MLERKQTTRAVLAAPANPDIAGARAKARRIGMQATFSLPGFI
jgi:hypothetical protein